MSYNPDGATDSWAMSSLAKIADAISQGYPTDPFDYVRASWADFGPQQAGMLGGKQIDFSQYMANLRNQQALEQMKADSAANVAGISGGFGLAGQQAMANAGLMGKQGDWALQRELKPMELASQEAQARMKADSDNKLREATLMAAAKQQAALYGAKGVDPTIAMGIKDVYNKMYGTGTLQANQAYLNAILSLEKKEPINLPTPPDKSWSWPSWMKSSGGAPADNWGNASTNNNPGMGWMP